jgi:cytochrome c-type biogenesis protein CcmH/NrfG
VQLGESAKVLRQADADPTALGDLVMRLRSRVAATPSDLESWYLLGHTLMRLDDAPGAVSAFERVYAEESDDPSVQVALAQARFVADRGTVTDENRALLDNILVADPQQPLPSKSSRSMRSGKRTTRAPRGICRRQLPAARPVPAPMR